MMPCRTATTECVLIIIGPVTAKGNRRIAEAGCRDAGRFFPDTFLGKERLLRRNGWESATLRLSDAYALAVWDRRKASSSFPMLPGSNK